jgi:hypothetical protein
LEFVDATTADTHGYPMTLSKDGRGARVQVRNFFLTYHVDYKKFRGPHTYHTVPLRSLGIDRDSNMLVVRLDQPASACHNS